MIRISTFILSLLIVSATSCTSSNPSSSKSEQALPSVSPKAEETNLVKVEEVKTLLIGTVKQERYAKMDGCGTYFKTLKAGRETYWLNGGPYIFVHADENDAVMNLDGKDIELTLVGTSPTPDPNHKFKVGDNFTYIYKAGDISVNLSYAITELCDPEANYGTCEWEDAEGTLTIEQGNRKQTIKVKGGFGC